MANTTNYYSVSDLAALLQVPRTTVNDWLKKFDRYIDFEMRGRRKVYTDASLEVLKLISEARDKGTALPDLELELSRRCAVRPDISPLTDDAGEEEGPGKDPAAENLPAVNFDFSGFLKEFEKHETRRTNSGRRSFALICVLLVLLLGVCCATLLLLGQLLTLRESSKTLAAQLAAAREESSALRRHTEKEFKTIASNLEKSRISDARSAEKLQKRLSVQRQQFEKVLSRLEKAEKRREKELEKLEKENFRLKAELETASRMLVQKQTQNQKIEKDLSVHRDRNSKLLQEMNRLKQELSVLKKKKAAPSVKKISVPSPAEKKEKK